MSPRNQNDRREGARATFLRRAAIAGLACVSVLSYGSVAVTLSGEGSRIGRMFKGAGVAHAPEQKHITGASDPEAFFRMIDEKSRHGLVVVAVNAPGCGVCAGMESAFHETRRRMQGFNFSVYTINAAHNPEIVERLGHTPEMGSRLHSFYRGEKIHVSAGVSDQAAHLISYLDGLFNIINGDVSHLDRYSGPQHHFR